MLTSGAKIQVQFLEEPEKLFPALAARAQGVQPGWTLTKQASRRLVAGWQQTQLVKLSCINKTSSNSYIIKFYEIQYTAQFNYPRFPSTGLWCAIDVGVGRTTLLGPLFSFMFYCSFLFTLLLLLCVLIFCFRF